MNECDLSDAVTENRRQNATKYNSWHAGQRYIHYGMQAKYNQWQGLARANNC